MAKEILVFAEQKGDSLTTAAKGAFGAAKELTPAGFSVSAIIAGKHLDSAVKQCFSLGASKVYVATHDELEHYRALTYTNVLTNVLNQYEPEIVIFGFSTTSTDLVPRVAYLSKVAALTGVTALSYENDKLLVDKPAYNEKLTVKYSLSGKFKMIILGVGAFSAPVPDAGASGETVTVAPSFKPEELIEEIVGVEVVEKSVDLSEAKFIVSGGRGCGSAEKFKIIFDTAAALGGQPASSRAVWDAGWTENDIHVGQTGGAVSPDVYIANGISGAIQHVAGIKKSKTIIVVNTDPEAPIWDVAHYGIVADLHKVLPLLVQKLT